MKRFLSQRSGIASIKIASIMAGVMVTGAVSTAIDTSLGNSQDKPTTKTDKCATEICHASILDRSVMHKPAQQRKCMDCHDYAVPSDHSFKLTMPSSELCESCHTLRLGPTIHEPVVEKDCTGCHDPHGSDHQLMLVADPAKGLCETCHTQNYLDKQFVHGPVAVGACIVCHEPHSSSYKALLTMEPKTLCVECHAESAPTGIDARHQHKPMEDGCSTCHDPHASNVKFQLHSENPDLCFTCHEGVKNYVNSVSTAHGPINEPDGCVSCHNPHFTRLAKLQRARQPDLCLSCHNKTIKTKDGRTLANMAKLLKDNPDHHGPIRDGACTSCHKPHGSNHFSLLSQDYPAEFYAPFEMKRYQLCFSCHIGDLVQDESGTGLTRFRNGDLNLHWLHVNQEKGRTCRACHEVHASKRPAHIREAVPYGKGGWLLEINFDQSEIGGSCAPACHKKKIYDRNAINLPEDEESIAGLGGEQ